MAKATKSIVKKTKKRSEEIVLPGNKYIYQSNRITNGRFPQFNTYHIKIFVCLLNQLQAAIQANMDGKNWTQLGLFEEVDNDRLRIGIPLSEIASPQNYKEVIGSFQELRKIDYNIESPTQKGYILYTGLIESFEAPVKENGKSVIYVNIVKSVARDLIEVDRRDGHPMLFTKYIYEVVMRSSSKYTWKIYTLIASWRSKGGFKITLERFRELLGLEPDEYPNYADLKRRVILPAQKELDHKADCWFECSQGEFEEKKGRKVVGLNFKIITPEFEDVSDMKKNQVVTLLREQLRFKVEDIAQLESIFHGRTDYGLLLGKIFELISYVTENKETIAHPKKYVIASLIKQFSK